MADDIKQVITLDITEAEKNLNRLADSFKPDQTDYNIKYGLTVDKQSLDASLATFKKTAESMKPKLSTNVGKGIQGLSGATGFQDIYKQAKSLKDNITPSAFSSTVPIGIRSEGVDALNQQVDNIISNLEKKEVILPLKARDTMTSSTDLGGTTDTSPTPPTKSWNDLGFGKLPSQMTGAFIGTKMVVDNNVGAIQDKIKNMIPPEVSSLATKAKDLGKKVGESLGKGVADGSKKTASTTKGFFDKLFGGLGKLGGVGGIAIGTAMGMGIVGGIRGAMRMVKQVMETALSDFANTNLFSTMFGNSAREMSTMFLDISRTADIAVGGMYRASSQAKQLAEGFNFSRGMAEQFAGNMTKLAVDASALWGIEMEKMAENLRAGVAGAPMATKRLREFGIIINDATIEATALSHGIIQQGEAMTQAQQATARYYLIQEALSHSNQYLSKTLEQPNQVAQRLKGSFTTLATAIGSLVMPIFIALANVAIAVAKILTQAVNAILAIFNIKPSTEVNDSLASIGENMAGAGVGADDMASGLGDASKKAKELKKQLAGFDIVNNLQLPTEPTSGAGGGAGSAGVGSMDMNLGNYDLGLDGIKTKADQVADSIKKVFNDVFGGLDYSKLLASFDNIRNAIGALGGTIWDGIKWAWDNILVPLTQWTITEAFPSFLNVLAGVLNFINPILQVFASILEPLWTNVLSPMFNFSGDAIIVALDTFALSFNKAGEFITKYKGVFENIAIILTSIAIGFGLVNTAIGIFSLVTGTATVVGGAFGAVLAFITSPITLVALAIGAVIAVGWLLIKNWDTVKEVAGNVWGWIKEKFQDFSNFLTGVFTYDWTNSFGVFGNVINFFFGGISNWISAIKQVFGGLINFIAGVFTGDWSRAWQGVMDIFGGMFNSMISFAKIPINGMIDLINGFLRGLNKVKIPDWVPGIGGKGFNVPTIPKLQQGGVVHGATTFIAGENGREVVMPLERNLGWITQLAGQIQNRMSDVGGRPQVIKLSLDSREFYEAIVEYKDDEEDYTWQ